MALTIENPSAYGTSPKPKGQVSANIKGVQPKASSGPRILSVFNRLSAAQLSCWLSEAEANTRYS